MEILNIYVGTWFQRTALHLKEIYKFLNTKKGPPGLDQEKLNQLWEELRLKDITLHEETEFDFISALYKGLKISISEDGIILLNFPGDDFDQACELFNELYTNKLTKVTNYLFSLGAPLPRVLSNLEDLLPFIIVTRHSEEYEIKDFFKSHSDNVDSTSANHGLEVHSGEKLIVINITDESQTSKFNLDNLVSYIVFFREFELQLANYLNRHRAIWDKIALIRESHTLRYADLPKVRETILDFSKEISFVDARLWQMGNNIISRKGLVDGTTYTLIKDLGLNRFEHLETNQKYVLRLWEMTEDYAGKTLNLLSSIFQENTQIELNAIKLITLFTALTSFFGMNIAFPWEERWPNTFMSSVYVLFAIIIISTLTYIILTKLIYIRKFSVNVFTFRKKPRKPS